MHARLPIETAQVAQRIARAAQASVLLRADTARSPCSIPPERPTPTRHGSARVGVELGRELPPGARSLPPANGCALAPGALHSLAGGDHLRPVRAERRALEEQPGV